MKNNNENIPVIAAGGLWDRSLLRSGFILCLLCLLQYTAMAQGASLTGKLVDSKGAPVRFANVGLLKQKDSSLVTTVLSDSAGKFSLLTSAEGTCFLRITAIGHSETNTDSFYVTGPQYSKDFGSIELKQDVRALNNVTITALRPTITQLADRMVVSVEGTAMAAGSTAYAVLSKAPGVFIDAEGNIQLNGRSGVTVMIDNKLTYLSARDLRTLLEGMSAENLKSIEIINNPSARYDAEGTSGILNINLRKNTQRGMNGSLYSSYNYNFKQHGFTSGGNINYKSGKWNSFLNLDAARRVGGREATFTRVFYGSNKTTYFDQVATGNFFVQGPPAIRLGTDYTINELHSIGFMANYTTNKAQQEFLTDTYIGAAPKTPAQFIDADNYSSNTYKNFTTNLHYTGKLDTLGTLLSADLDYVRITNRGEADFINSFTNLSNDTKTNDLLYTSTPNGYDIYSAKIDFTKPFGKLHKLESGVKASQVVSDNDFRFYFNNGTLALDPQRTNHFKYDEKIYAAYFTWSSTLSDKISAQAGLRAEETHSRGESITTGQVTERNYLNFF
ncbi:MAG TPA: outer membrane beta-barrel family protein, partial [Chitinophagaceae bacterium]|nr:outer membrane beta-barrel family protein [Chitinophagaceae bacterium]